MPSGEKKNYGSNRSVRNFTRSVHLSMDYFEVKQREANRKRGSSFSPQYCYFTDGDREYEKAREKKSKNRPLFDRIANKSSNQISKQASKLFWALLDKRMLLPFFLGGAKGRITKTITITKAE